MVKLGGNNRNKCMQLKTRQKVSLSRIPRGIGWDYVVALLFDVSLCDVLSFFQRANMKKLLRKRPAKGRPEKVLFH